ncbi:MAG: hypothetical protein MK106_10260 [Mariniblastus sp.]|nr:hypothetical protein [Mariniblastus sp.]
MYGHERSLVNEYSGRPFVLLGVNNDDEIQTAKKAVRDNNLNWRSWFDGKGGPIVGAFRVNAFPTILLVDHRGIIRHRSPFAEGFDLDKVIAGLVQEAENAGVTGGAEPKPQVREFVDSTGEHRMMGSYIGFQDGQVALETESGKTLQIPWDRLGLDAQRYVANQRLKADGLGRIAKKEIAFSFDTPQQFLDSSGAHSIQGTFIALDGRSVVIWQTDGTETRVAWNKLSRETKDMIGEEIKKRD